jgi:peptide/nickel transport system substrate-binding protein
MLQAKLSAVGFDVSIRQLEQSAFLDRVYGPRHDFAAAVMGVPGDPGLSYLQSLADLTGIAVPLHDPVAAQRIFAERTPVAWLYHARGVQGMNRRIHGVQMDLRGELPSVAAWRVTP